MKLLLAAAIFCALLVGCGSNNTDELQKLRQEVGALKVARTAATPTLEQPIVLNRQQKPYEQVSGLFNVPYCVTYRLAGTSTERCRTAQAWGGAPPIPAEWAPGGSIFDTDDLKYGMRLEVVFDDVTPEVTLAKFRSAS